MESKQEGAGVVGRNVRRDSSKTGKSQIEPKSQIKPKQQVQVTSDTNRERGNRTKPKLEKVRRRRSGLVGSRADQEGWSVYEGLLSTLYSTTDYRV